MMDSRSTTRGVPVRTYVCRVETGREEDGRWSAVVPALLGCATWGGTKEEAFESIQQAARACVETLIESGRSVPKDPSIDVIEAPAVAVTV
jgi:predicted RNase H-like HicB family nuclease